MQIETTYEQAMGRKSPEQVAIAIAKDANGRCNPITLGWVMCTSMSPPMLAMSIGLSRHSLEAVREAKEFVISFPSKEMADDAMFFGTHLARQMDKLTEQGSATQKAGKIDCVLLADAVANFECELDSELLTGDHVIFAGRVVCAHMNKDASVRRLYTLSKGFEMGGAVGG